MTGSVTDFVVTPLHVHTPEATSLLRAYLFDIVSRYWGREATSAEVDAATSRAPRKIRLVVLFAQLLGGTKVPWGAYMAPKAAFGSPPEVRDGANRAWWRFT